MLLFILRKLLIYYMIFLYVICCNLLMLILLNQQTMHCICIKQTLTIEIIKQCRSCTGSVIKDVQ